MGGPNKLLAELDGKKLVVVPILRAGLGMLEGMMRLIPTAEVGFLGMVFVGDTVYPALEVTDRVLDRAQYVEPEARAQPRARETVCLDISWCHAGHHHAYIAARRHVGEPRAQPAPDAGEGLDLRGVHARAGGQGHPARQVVRVVSYGPLRPVDCRLQLGLQQAGPRRRPLQPRRERRGEVQAVDEGREQGDVAVRRRGPDLGGEHAGHRERGDAEGA